MSPRRLPLRKDLRASMGDGSAYSVMVGIGETYLPAFVLAIGMGQVTSGLISTIPLLIGSLLQLVSPWAIAWLNSHRRWVMLCAIVQSLAFVPLIIGAIVGSMPVWLVFAIASVYWAASLGCGPAWNTWMGTIVPSRMRAKFFARRSRASQLAILVGFLTGGVLLQVATPTGHDTPAGHELWAFALLFLIAGVCRFVSASFLFSTSEPEPPGKDHRRVSFVSMLRGHPNTGLLVFLLLMQVCVQISGPYFTPYMRHQLEMPYWQYAAVFGIQFASRMLAMPYLGGIAHRLGADRLLWMSSLGVIPLAALWMVSSSFIYLLVIQVLAGIFWGGYELAFLLLFFEAIPARERTSLLTNFNVANSAAICVGSLFGGWLLSWLGKDQQSYHILFALSSCLRAIVVSGLVWLPLIRLKIKPMAVRSIGMRATDTSLDEPVLPSIEE
jgi:MFS family permease